jgi:hypothetical protein
MYERLGIRQARVFRTTLGDCRGSKILLFAAVLTYGCVAHAGDCTFWKTKPLLNGPDSIAVTSYHSVATMHASFVGGMRIDEYLISDTSKIVLLSQAHGTEVFDADSNYEDTYFHAKIVQVIKGDTVVLDADLHNISDLTFSLDMSKFAYCKTTFQGQESSKGDVYLFDLRSRQKRVLHVSIGTNSPTISPGGDYVLYADYGDLHLCDLELGASQLVFRGGGSYLMGTGCIDSGTDIREVKWAKNGESAIFQFTKSWNDQKGEWFELFWSP